MLRLIQLIIILLVVCMCFGCVFVYSFVCVECFVCVRWYVGGVVGCSKKKTHTRGQTHERHNLWFKKDHKWASQNTQPTWAQSSALCRGNSYRQRFCGRWTSTPRRAVRREWRTSWQSSIRQYQGASPGTLAVGRKTKRRRNIKYIEEMLLGQSNPSNLFYQQSSYRQHFNVQDDKVKGERQSHGSNQPHVLPWGHGEQRLVLRKTKKQIKRA